MALLRPSRREIAHINGLVTHYVQNKHLISTFVGQVLPPLLENPELMSFVHSIRHRLKDPEHLRDKLIRKWRKCQREGVQFDITKDNLFVRINDLAGIRILHLHTSQIEQIDKLLKIIFEEYQLKLIEGPFARTWDDFSKAFFEKIGMTAERSDTMYTSVHYVLSSNSLTSRTCEVQVRTLMEEVWGEVDHKINYPHPTESVACREQLRALGRSTSSTSSLVDSIFSSFEDFTRTKLAQQKVNKPKSPMRRKRGDENPGPN
jgi:putative GTP pyrophosphokinase